MNDLFKPLHKALCMRNIGYCPAATATSLRLPIPIAVAIPIPIAVAIPMIV